jgi:predicted nucleotidyltransferase component of viral defense system
MILHKNTELFKQAIQATSHSIGLKEIYVEKDYWVTLALKIIFTSEQREWVVFKGGTALSKAFKSIERFSEDIDLVLLKTENDTANQLKKKLKTISRLIVEELPEIEISGVTKKRGMNRKTAHTFSKVFNGDYGQIRDCIILETSWLGNFKPFCSHAISSFIYEMMIATNQNQLAEEYDMFPFNVRVLKPERTICEKIMSLIRFSYSDNPINDLNLKIRHIYDISRLMTNPELLNFIKSKGFEKMLLHVAKDDFNSFNQNTWLAYHPKESLIFSNPTNLWKSLQKTYHGKFKLLVYGKLPDDKEILQSLITLSKQIADIDWSSISRLFEDRSV